MTPPPHDPTIETRLLIIAEMLDKAVGEVRRLTREVRSGVDPLPEAPLRVEVTLPGLIPPPAPAGLYDDDDDQARSADVQ